MLFNLALCKYLFWCDLWWKEMREGLDPNFQKADLTNPLFWLRTMSKPLFLNLLLSADSSVYFIDCKITYLTWLLFIFPLMKTGFPPCGWTHLKNCCTMTMSWTMETSGVSTLTTDRQTQSPRKRRRGAGRFTATVHMESMYCSIFSRYITFYTVIHYFKVDINLFVTVVGWQ